MHSEESIATLFHRHNGVMTRSELARAGLHSRTLQRFITSGWIARPRSGFYEWIADDGPDEIALLLRIFPEGIVCLHSALFVHGYTDRVPNAWHLAVPLNATRSKFCQAYPPVKPHFRTPHSLTLGSTHVEFSGHRVPVYDKERTICDCIAHRNRMDREIFIKAIRAFRSDPKRNIARLMHYAHLLRIKRTASDIIELCQ